MGLIPPVVVDVSDVTSIGDVRRRCAELCAQLGLDDTATGRVAIIATEIASNLVKHAVPGSRVIGRAAERNERVSIELIGIDRGPGIENPSRALRDGYSTSTTPGTGLGAVRRLADEFQLHSLPGAGTVVLARVNAPAAATLAPATAPGAASLRPALRGAPLEIGVVAVPAPGEAASGDAWAVEHGGPRSWLLVADGLGHGPDAAVAARAAVRSFHERKGASPAEQVRAMHVALRRTRGAAVAVAEVRRDTREVVFAGLGNIAGAVVAPDGSTHNMVSHDGIAGHVAARIAEFTYALPERALVILHSDGVSQRWDLGRYPGVTLRDPGIVAAILLRDSARGRDDATVLVAREHTDADTAA